MTAGKSILFIVVLLFAHTQASAPSTTATLGQFTLEWNATESALTVTHAAVPHPVYETPKLPFVSASTTAWGIQNWGNWGKQSATYGPFRAKMRLYC